MRNCRKDVWRKTKIGMRSAAGPWKDIGRQISWKDVGWRKSRKISEEKKIEWLSAGGSREDVRR